MVKKSIQELIYSHSLWRLFYEKYIHFLIKTYPSIKDFDLRIYKYINRKKCLETLNKKLHQSSENQEPLTNLKKFLDKFSKLENENNTTKDVRLNCFQKDNSKNKSYLRVINNLKKKHELSLRSSKPIQLLGIPLRSMSSPKNVKIVTTTSNNNPYYVQTEMNANQVKSTSLMKNAVSTLSNCNITTESNNLVENSK